MSYTRHHAIIVTTFTRKLAAEAYVKAAVIFPPGMVTNIMTSPMNGQHSIFIIPDGGLEGRQWSDQCDEMRDEFIAWLSSKSYTYRWVEVQYGDDEMDNKIIRDGYHEVAVNSR